MLFKSLQNQYLESLRILREENSLILVPVSLDGIHIDLLGHALADFYPQLRKTFSNAILSKKLEKGKIIFFKKNKPQIILMPVQNRFTGNICNDMIAEGIKKINQQITEDQIIALNVSKWNKDNIETLKKNKKFLVTIYDYNELILKEKTNE